MKIMKSNENKNKTLKKKLQLNKETIRELRNSELKMVAGGSGDSCIYTCSRVTCNKI